MFFFFSRLQYTWKDISVGEVVGRDVLYEYLFCYGMKESFLCLKRKGKKDEEWSKRTIAYVRRKERTIFIVLFLSYPCLRVRFFGIGWLCITWGFALIRGKTLERERVCFSFVLSKAYCRHLVTVGWTKGIDTMTWASLYSWHHLNHTLYFPSLDRLFSGIRKLLFFSTLSILYYSGFDVHFYSCNIACLCNSFLIHHWISTVILLHMILSWKKNKTSLEQI